MLAPEALGWGRVLFLLTDGDIGQVARIKHQIKVHLHEKAIAESC